MIEDFQLNNNFSHDLKIQKIRERAIAEMLANEPIEVKTEMGKWKKTGNIAIEVEWNGKPSGLYKTESTLWWHTLEIDGHPILHLVFPVQLLKFIITKMQKNGTLKEIMGGDYKLSKIFLLPLSELFNKENSAALINITKKNESQGVLI